MDIEEGLKSAGYFGKYQKKVVFTLFFLNLICPSIVLSITYVGMAPDWECMSEKNKTSLSLTPDKRCLYYEGTPHNCTPLYHERFHSISSEVSYHLNLALLNFSGIYPPNFLTVGSHLQSFAFNQPHPERVLFWVSHRFLYFGEACRLHWSAESNDYTFFGRSNSNDTHWTVS